MHREEALRHLPSEEEMAEQIQREWERMHQRGETIRVGDGAGRSARRFWSVFGAWFLRNAQKGD